MKGIIQNQDEVKALLEGRRTMFSVPIREDLLPNCFDYQCLGEIKNGVFEFENNTGGFNHVKAHYKVGERLFVKETYYGSSSPYKELLGYIADGDYPHGVLYRICPSTWIKEKDSRITLTIESVGCEQIKDISVDDATREGFGNQEPYIVNVYEECDSYSIAQFAYYWQQKHGSYNPNQWVWKYGVKVEVKK